MTALSGAGKGTTLLGQDRTRRRPAGGYCYCALLLARRMVWDKAREGDNLGLIALCGLSKVG